MKLGINLSTFLDKEKLKKVLPAKLKKTVSALRDGRVDELPFFMEVDYFGPGEGFMGIGVAKDIQKHFLQMRVKGNGGLDDQKKKIVVDKKKVGIGTVRFNTETNIFEFYLERGFMKPKETKITIRSIDILKKIIGGNYEILKGEVTSDVSVLDLGDTDENSTEEPKTDLRTNDLLTLKVTKIEQNIGKLEGAVGVAPPEKVQPNIEKYERILDELIEEAESDGQIDGEERKQINQLKRQLKRMSKQLERLDGRKIQLNPKRRIKVKENISKIDDRLQEMISKLDL